MRITERTIGDVTVLDAHGRMTVTEGCGMIRASVGALLRTGQQQLVLNLGQVPYMDSTCVGELVAVFLTTRKQGGMLKFAAVTKRVGDLLAVAKLNTVFEVFDSDTAAVKSFASR